MGYVATISADEIGLYRIPNKSKLVIYPPLGQLVGNLALRLDDDADKNTTGHRKIMFGLGINSDTSESKMPFDLKMTFDPVSCVDYAHRPEAKYVIQGKTLTMLAPQETLGLDIASGRILEFLMTSPDANTPADNSSSVVGKVPEGQSRWSIRLSFVPSEFRHRLDAIHTTTAKVPNAYDGNRAISSLLNYACDEDPIWQWLGVTRDHQARHEVQQLLDHNLFEPLDKSVSKFLANNKSNAADKEHTDFFVPSPLPSHRK